MFRFLINILLPQPPNVAQLEKMSAADLRAAVPPTTTQPRDWVLPIFSYENPLIKNAIWEVKYRGNRVIAKLLGDIIAEELTEWLVELSETENFRAPLFVPIPLARKRERERGFNQCVLIAKEACMPTGMAARGLAGFVELRTDILIKIKETESQTKSVNREKRFKNLEDCFRVTKPEEIKGRNIVLFDDVTTTGATLQEARHEFISNGARKVIAITVAH